MISYQVEFRSKKLKEIICRKLGKDVSEELSKEDVEKITELSLDKRELDGEVNDITTGDLLLLPNLTSLMISGVEIGDKEVSQINRLSRLRVLQITNLKLDFGEKRLNSSISELILTDCTGIKIKDFEELKDLSKVRIVGCKDTDLRGISSFEQLEQLYLQNQYFKNIDEVLKMKKLKTLNLDGTEIGDDRALSDVSTIDVSRNPQNNVAEKDWNVEGRKIQNVSISYLRIAPEEELRSLRGQEIIINEADISFIKTDEGKALLSRIRKQGNTIHLYLQNTASLSKEQLKELNEACDIDRVHIQTGWDKCQDRGYDMATYQAIKDEIQKIISGIDPNSPEPEKFMKVYEILKGRIKYDYTALEANKNESKYYTSRNLENGLLNRTCVCAGYADILKNVLAELQIESRYVEGYTDTGELHAWNQVKINGVWYNVDLTWDAINNNRNNGLTYCLKDDATFGKTHKPLAARSERVEKCAAAMPPQSLNKYYTTANSYR